jgi:hypothetical protein
MLLTIIPSTIALHAVCNRLSFALEHDPSFSEPAVAADAVLAGTTTITKKQDKPIAKNNVSW